MVSRSAKITLRVPKKFKDLVDRRIAGGDYEDHSDFFQKLLAKVMIQEEKARLEQLLKEGLESGPPIVADEKFWKDFHKGVRERAKARKAGRSKAKA